MKSEVEKKLSLKEITETHENESFRRLCQTQINQAKSHATEKDRREQDLEKFKLFTQGLQVGLHLGGVQGHLFSI